MIRTGPATMTNSMYCPLFDLPNFLPEWQCKNLITKYGDELEPSRTAGADELRVSSQRYFEDDALTGRIAMVVGDYADRANIDIGRGDAYESLSIVRYDKGGKYDFHMDNQMSPIEDRKIAVVLALNSDFKGGGTEWLWPYPSKPSYLPPSTGSIVMFPSVLLHRGIPVQSGTRWIVVTWALGPPWR